MQRGKNTARSEKVFAVTTKNIGLIGKKQN